MRKLRRVPKDKKTGIAKKYLSGSRNPAAKAAEIKRTAKLYKEGAFIDIKAVQQKIVLKKRLKALSLNMVNLQKFTEKVKVHIFQAVLVMYQWLHGQWVGLIVI